MEARQSEGVFRPLPDCDSELFKSFWEAVSNGELIVQECMQTGKKVWPPRHLSPYAPGAELRWIKVEGKGEVYTYNIVNRAFFPYFHDKVPYAIVVIDLGEGIRMLGNARDIEPDQIYPGMRMEVVFERITEKLSLVNWRPYAD